MRATDGGGDLQLLRQDSAEPTSLPPTELVESAIAARAPPKVGAMCVSESLQSVSAAFADSGSYNPLLGPPPPLHIVAFGGFNRPGNFRQLRDADDSPYSISSGTRTIQPQHYPRTERTIDKPRMEDFVDCIKIEPSTSAIDFRRGKGVCRCQDAMKNIRPRSVAAVLLSAPWIDHLREKMERAGIIAPAGPAIDKPTCACGRIGPDFFLQFSNWVSGQDQPFKIVGNTHLLRISCDNFIAKIAGATRERVSRIVAREFSKHAGAKRFMVDRAIDPRDQAGTLMTDPILRNCVSYVPINGESNSLRRTIGTPVSAMRARARAIFGHDVVLPDSRLENDQFIDATVRDHLPRDQSRSVMDEEWTRRIIQCTSPSSSSDLYQKYSTSSSSPLTKTKTKVIGTAHEGMFIPSNKDSHPRITKTNTWAISEAETVAKRRRMTSAIAVEPYDSTFAQ